MSNHSTAHFNATSDYLAKHGKRARREGALARLESRRLDVTRLGWAGYTDRIDREIAILKGRLGKVVTP